MQQVERPQLIQQGNNSYIHRYFQGAEVFLFSNQNLFFFTKQYVIKSVLHNESSVHEKECQDLCNEWNILSKVDHPNIIKMFEFNDRQNINFFNKNCWCCQLKMESALGDMHQLVNLSDLESFTTKSMLLYIEQTGQALEYLHNLDIAHNDVKPENILIFSREQAKLADFGFSQRDCNLHRDVVKRWESRSLNLYTSPEIIKFRNQLHEASEFMKGQQLANQYFHQFSEQSSDIYALTTALFISIYRRPPIYGAFPSFTDPLYSILLKNPDDYWDLDSIQNIEHQYIESECLSQEQFEDLKILIEQGLAEENDRININEWNNHDFWKNLHEEKEDEKQQFKDSKQVSKKMST